MALIWARMVTVLKRWEGLGEGWVGVGEFGEGGDLQEPDAAGVVLGVASKEGGAGFGEPGEVLGEPGGEGVQVGSAESQKGKGDGELGQGSGGEDAFGFVEGGVVVEIEAGGVGDKPIGEAVEGVAGVSGVGSDEVGCGEGGDVEGEVEEGLGGGVAGLVWVASRGGG